MRTSWLMDSAFRVNGSSPAPWYRLALRHLAQLAEQPFVVPFAATDGTVCHDAARVDDKGRGQADNRVFLDDRTVAIEQQLECHRVLSGELKNPVLAFSHVDRQQH